MGKSSLINRLLGVKRLAHTSSSPGRTRSVNFYRINESCNFVDLPGYGYAKVPLAVRRSWKPMVEGVMERRRRRIALAVLVVDARRPPTEMDLAMREWLESKRVPYVVAATKSDKLSAAERKQASQWLAQAFGSAAAAGAPPVLVSETGTGIRELWNVLDSALYGATEGHAPRRV